MSIIESIPLLYDSQIQCTRCITYCYVNDSKVYPNSFQRSSSANSSGLCRPWPGWFKSWSWSDQCDLPFKRNPNTVRPKYSADCNAGATPENKISRLASSVSRL